MNLFQRLFGSDARNLPEPARKLDCMASAAQSYEASAKDLQRHNLHVGAETAYRKGAEYYQAAAVGLNAFKRQLMLRPLQPSREAYLNALEEYRQACEAVAHQYLLGLSPDSEISKTVAQRFRIAHQALFCLIYEQDITEEEFNRRVTDLGEPENENQNQ